MENNLEQENATQLSKEEIAKRREEISEFYSSNIKHLEIQVKYESLLTEIEELRAKRARAQMFIAQVFAENNPEDGQDPSENEELEAAPRRQLKRD